MLNNTRLHVCTKRHSYGFSIIDLMILVAVITTLSMLATPPYQTHNIRTKVAECISFAGPAKLSISQYHTSISSWPPDAEKASLATYGMSAFCGGFVDYNPSDGSFQLNVNEDVLGDDIGQIQPQLTPEISDASTVSWKCSLGTTEPSLAKYLPSNCREA